MDSTLSITFPEPRIALIGVRVMARPPGVINKAGGTPSPNDNNDPSLVWKELHRLFESFSTNAELDVIVLAISGKFNINNTRLTTKSNERYEISMQKALKSIEKCMKPVIGATNGPCWGPYLALGCACNIRMSASDTRFRIDIDNHDIAIRLLAKVAGAGAQSGWLHEVALSDREFDAQEALRVGLVNVVLKTEEATSRRALELARIIVARGGIVAGVVRRAFCSEDERSSQRDSEYFTAQAAADLDQAMGVGSLMRTPRLERL